MAITGVSGTHALNKAETFKCIRPEGQSGHIQPFVLPVSVSL